MADRMEAWRLSLINDYCLRLKRKYVGERIVALSVCNSLFINTYLPCDDGSVSSSDIVIEILSIITDLINACNYDSIFLASDLNTNLSSDRKNASLVKTILMDNSMSIMVPVDTDLNVCHTFSNDKRGSSSQIYFICLSRNIRSYVQFYSTVGAHNNFSDHEPCSFAIAATDYC